MAVGGFYVMLRWEAKQGNAADCTSDLWEIGLTAAVVGVFVGRLAAMISDGVNPATSPADILIVRAGVATGWASVAAIATVGWLGRRELWPVFDGLAAASLAGLAGWHAGCVARASCLGSQTDLPWAVHQTGSPVGRHPVELYAALLFAAAAVGIAMWRERGRPPSGAPAAVALMAAGIIRLATEPLRPSLSAGPVGWYITATAAGGAILAWRVVTARRSSQERTAGT